MAAISHNAASLKPEQALIDCSAPPQSRPATTIGTRAVLAGSSSSCNVSDTS